MQRLGYMAFFCVDEEQHYENEKFFNENGFGKRSKPIINIKHWRSKNVRAT